MILHSYEIRNISSNWCLMDCQSFTYHPHSNECGPSSILALMVIILHFYSSSGMLILFIHYNITKLCRWWVAKTPIEVTFNPYPTSQLFKKKRMRILHRLYIRNLTHTTFPLYRNTSPCICWKYHLNSSQWLYLYHQKIYTTWILFIPGIPSTATSPQDKNITTSPHQNFTDHLIPFGTPLPTVDHKKIQGMKAKNTQHSVQLYGTCIDISNIITNL